MTLGALELGEDEAAQLGRGIGRPAVELARIGAEVECQFLPALDVEDQLPRGHADRELRERPHVSARDDGRSVAVDAKQRLTVHLTCGQAGQLEQRRHEVDGAHLGRDDGRVERAGRREDQRHLHDLVEESRAVHVVDALDVLLLDEALAPGLAVVGQEREDRALAQPQSLELLEERRHEYLRLSLDRRPVALAHLLECGCRVRLDPLDDLLLGGEPVLALRVEDVVGHVRGPVVDVEEKRLVALLPQPPERGFERLTRAEDVRLGLVLEQVVRVEHEAADLVAVGRESPKDRLERRIERRIPMQVAVVVRAHAGDDRGRRRRRPRRGADRLVEANAAGRELVDRLRVQEPGAVAAQMIRPQCVGHVDDDVHSAADCSDGLAWGRHEAGPPLRALRRRHDLALRQRDRPDRDPVVRADRDGERDPHRARRVPQLLADRPRSVLRRRRGRPARVSDDERRGGPRELGGGGGDPASAHHRRDRAVAADGPRLRRRPARRSGGDRARSAFPRRRRAGGVPMERAAGSEPGSSRARQLVGAPLGGVLVAVFGATGAVDRRCDLPRLRRPRRGIRGAAAGRGRG